MFKKKNKDSSDIQNWYKDRHQWLTRFRNIMTIFSLVCLIISLLTASAIYFILPYKSVEPFVIQIDQKSGITQRVDPVTVDQMSANDALKKYFIVKYIRARESWILGGALQNPYNYDNYAFVSYMTQPASNAAEGYSKQLSPSNTESFVSRLGVQGSRSIKFKSIQLEPKNRSIVRALISESGSGAEPDSHVIINLEFDFVKLDMTKEQSYINPLGFMVNNYRVIEEVVNE